MQIDLDPLRFTKQEIEPLSVSFQSFKDRQSLEKARVFIPGLAEPVDLGLCPPFKT